MINPPVAGPPSLYEPHPTNANHAGPHRPHPIGFWQRPALANSRYNLRLGALAQSRCKLLIYNYFSVSRRAMTMLDHAISVPKTHLVLRLIFLTVVPLPTHSCQAR